MSTTLTNGLKLPDKGSVDWYADMQSNYAILDGAVGTVAEHTTQIAGKAPAVHTHTKSDVTDLFNSANTWGAENTYTNILLTLKHTELEIGVLPASNQTKRYRFTDQNNANLGWVQHRVSTSGDSFIELCSINRFSNGQLSPQGSDVANSVTIGLHSDGSRYLNVLGDVYPDLPTRVCNLGTSTNQWNNLYAKNYYYNGVAWGLDKSNVWSVTQFCSQNTIHVRNVNPGVAPSSDISAGMRFENANASYVFTDIVGKVFTSGTTFVNLMASNKFTNGALDPNGTSVSKNLQIGVRSNGEGFIYTDCGWRSDLKPNASESGVYNLGTSTNKWKTLNGINPGALSLPNFDSDGYVDLTSNLTENVQYIYTPAVDGWLALYVQVNGFHAENAVGIFNADQTLGNNSFRWAASVTAAINLQRQTGKYFGSVFLPVKAGYRYYCWLKVNQSTTLGQKLFIFYKAKGNV